MKLVWTRLALEDRRRIRNRIASDNPSAALAMDALIGAKAGKLLHIPGLGRPGRLLGTREIVVHKHYVLIFDVAGDTIRVLRLLHTAQKWSPHPKGSS